MSFGYAVYFTERDKHRVVRWDPDSGDVDIVAGEPKDKTPDQTLRAPYGLAVDKSGTLLVADKLHHRICQLKNTRLIALSLKDSARSRVHRSDSPLNYDPRPKAPTGLFMEDGGSLLCTFSDEHTIYRIQDDGELVQLLGIPPNQKYLFNPLRENVPAAEVRDTSIRYPAGIVKRKDGTIVFIERGHQALRIYHPASGLGCVFPFSLHWQYSNREEGPDLAAIQEYHPGFPGSIALDANDDLYMTEVRHGCVMGIDFRMNRIRKVIQVVRHKDRPNGGVTAMAFGPDGTAWILDSAAVALEAYAPTPQGFWKHLGVRLTSLKGDPIRIPQGGSGIVLGNY